MRCSDRTCVVCSADRGHELRDNLVRRLKAQGRGKQRWLRMLTLTVGHTIDEDLPTVLARLERAWQQVRKHLPSWRIWTRGGVRFLEIKFGPSGWHPHYHLLIEGGFLPIRALREAWVKAGGGRQLRIDSVRGIERAAEYVTKYVTKGWVGFKTWEIRAYLNLVLRGKRMYSWLGSWWGCLPKRELAICPHCGLYYDTCTVLMPPDAVGAYLRAMALGPPPESYAID